LGNFAGCWYASVLKKAEFLVEQAEELLQKWDAGGRAAFIRAWKLPARG
jgi:hypothetical protein